MRITRNALVFFTLLVFVGISIIFTAVPGPVSADGVSFYGSQMNINEHNGTGRAANDLEVYLNGNALISRWWSDGCPFRSFSYGYDSTSNMTTLRFYNGIVPHCGRVDTCLEADTTNLSQRYLSRWSYDGIAGPVVGASLSHDIKVIQPGFVDVIIANTPKDGGPETIGIIQIGASNTVYTLPELLWRNEALNKIPWSVEKTNVPLKLGQSLIFSSIPMPDQAVSIVYRAKIWLDSDPKNVMEYVGQFVRKPVVTPQQ
jgi:hypothetical protein